MSVIGCLAVDTKSNVYGMCQPSNCPYVVATDVGHGAVLPWVPARDRPRHPLLLGRQDGLLRPQAVRETSFQVSLACSVSGRLKVSITMRDRAKRVMTVQMGLSSICC